MVNNIWFNLASQDLEKSKNFYRDVGFEIMERPEQEGKMFGIKAKKGSPIMIVAMDQFESYIHRVPYGNDALISMSVDTKEEAEQLKTAVQRSGGKIIDQPKERDGFYGFTFEDIDGHFFNILVFNE
ncbi:VOC family protein [Staphylococcus simulans]